MRKSVEWKKWLMIGIVVLIGTTAVVLLVIGVASHDERVLLTVCWDVSGKARYIDDEIERFNEADPCEGVEELIWAKEQIPITVSTVTTPIDGEPSLISEDDSRHRVLDQTIHDLNRELGFEAFVRRSSGKTLVSAWVHFGGGIEAKRPSHPGYVFHRRIDGKLEGHVYIRSDVESNDRLLSLVCRHELLHLLGLAHDDFEASIMFPVRTDDTFERMSTAHVTDADRARLRELYDWRSEQ